VESGRELCLIYSKDLAFYKKLVTMANSFTALKLFAVVAGANILVQCHSSADTVRATCLQTPYPDVCEKALKSDPRSSSDYVSVGTLAEILINRVEYIVKTAMQEIKNESDGAKDEATVDTLSVCSSAYSIILGDLKNAKKAIDAPENQTKKFKESLGNAATRFDWCEAPIAHQQSPLTSLNEQGKRLLAVTEKLAMI
jgi:pectinesterase inhibitor-like protein